MKSKLVGYLVSAAFILVVVAIAFRITAVRNLVLPSTPAAS